MKIKQFSCKCQTRCLSFRLLIIPFHLQYLTFVIELKVPIAKYLRLIYQLVLAKQAYRGGEDGGEIQDVGYAMGYWKEAQCKIVFTESWRKQSWSCRKESEFIEVVLVITQGRISNQHLPFLPTAFWVNCACCGLNKIANKKCSKTILLS